MESPHQNKVISYHFFPPPSSRVSASGKSALVNLKKRCELQTGRGRGPSVAFARKSVFADTVDVFHIVAVNVSGRRCVSSQHGCCAFVCFFVFFPMIVTYFHFLKFLLQKEFQHLFNKSDKGLQTEQNDELSCSSRDWRGFLWLTGSCILNRGSPRKGQQHRARQ